LTGGKEWAGRLIFQVTTQEFSDFFAEIHLIWLVSLCCCEEERSITEVNILYIERDDRTKANPGTQHQMKKDVVAPVLYAWSLRDSGHKFGNLLLGKCSWWGAGADGTAYQTSGIARDVSCLVEVLEEYPQRCPQDVHRGRLLFATVTPCLGRGRRNEFRYVQVGDLGDIATVANLVRPVRKETDVASILANGAGCPAVGFELSDESVESGFDIHGVIPRNSDLSQKSLSFMSHG